MPLSETAIRNAKPKDKPYKLTDGEGMFLLVHPNGGKYWRMKYRIRAKEKLYYIGVYPEISLAEARERRVAARKMLANGGDPQAAKKQSKLDAYRETENSFDKIALEWQERKQSVWTARYAAIVLKRLEADMFPFLKGRPISDITASEVLAIARKIEERGAHDLAHRATQILGQIFRYAIATGRAERDVCADLRGALMPIKKTHHAYLKAADLPEFLSKLEMYDGGQQTILAIKLLMLTFVRTVELRGAEWSEIDFDKAEWRIPAERMKMRHQHIVPLSNQSLAVLERLQKLNRKEQLVFPSHNNPKKCMSENTILYALYRMGYHSRATGHGFRSTASTILNENGYRADVIERQLAHTEGNKVRASYNHAEYLPERKKMMQDWADYLDSLAANATAGDSKAA